MTGAPHETVVTALLDAVATGPVLPSGGIYRAAVETADVLTGISDNLAAQRYRDEHPHAVLGESRAVEIKEGRQLLARDGVAWLLAKGHLRVVDGGGLALSKQYRVSDGNGKFKVYVPGSGREESLFFSTRRPNPERLGLIRESIATLGDLRGYFPVLEDVDGNVVDGRHRRAIDPTWPAATQKVARQDRLAAMLAGNTTNAWTKKDWAKLREHADHVTGKKIKGSELARLALLENHERSNVKIGELVGCSEFTVRGVRDDLEATSIISKWRDPRTPGSKDGTPAQSSSKPRGPRKQDNPQLRAAVREHLIDGTLTRPVEVELGKRFGHSEQPVRMAKKEIEAELKAEGAPVEPKPATPTVGTVPFDFSRANDADYWVQLIRQHATEPDRVLWALAAEAKRGRAV